MNTPESYHPCPPPAGSSAAVAPNQGESTTSPQNAGDLSATDSARKINAGETARSAESCANSAESFAISAESVFANTAANGASTSSAPNGGGEHLAPGSPASRGARPRMTRKQRMERLRRVKFNRLILRTLNQLVSLGVIRREQVVHVTQRQALRLVCNFLRDRRRTQQRRDDPAAAGFSTCMNRVLSQWNVLGEDLTRRLAHHLASSRGHVLHRAPLRESQQQHHTWSQHQGDANLIPLGLPSSGSSLPGRSSRADRPSLRVPSTDSLVPRFIPGANHLIPRDLPFAVIPGANPFLPRDLPFPVIPGANPFLLPGPFPVPAYGLIRFPHPPVRFPHPPYPGSSHLP